MSQTLLNLLALAILGATMFGTVGLFVGRQQALVLYVTAPFVVLLAVLVAPALLRSGGPSRSQRMQSWLAGMRGALRRVRSGLAVFRRPSSARSPRAPSCWAWALQWVACFVLLAALGLDDSGAGVARPRPCCSRST